MSSHRRGKGSGGGGDRRDERSGVGSEDDATRARDPRTSSSSLSAVSGGPGASGGAPGAMSATGGGGGGGDGGGDGGGVDPSGPAGSADTVLTLEGKVVVVGDMDVGKTSLLAQLVKDEFNPKEKPTVGVLYSRKTIKAENLTLHLNLWDTAGQERFRAMNSLYYRNSAAAIIVYDITNPGSFDNVKFWIKQLHRYNKKGLIIALAGNKADLVDGRKVPEIEAFNLADSEGLLFSEVSARTGDGVKRFFNLLAKSAQRSVMTEDSGFQIIKLEKLRVSKKGSDKESSTSSGGCC